MQVGMLHLFENPAGRTEQECVREQLNIMCAAEDLGFDHIWPAEHHFTEYGYLGSPMVGLAYVAARTKRIKLAQGIVVLPFHNPIRVAEDIALLDLMSDGRVMFGVGRGYQPGEYKGFNLDQSKSREMFDEGIRLIVDCWTKESVTFKGKYYQCEDICVRPKPVQRPHPPVYMAVLSPDTWTLAGRYGHNVLTSCAFGQSEESLAAGVKEYRRARREAGHDPAAGRVAVLMQIYVGATMEDALRDYEPAVMWYYRTIAKYVAAKGPVVSTYEAYQGARELASSADFESLRRGPGMAVGDAHTVAEKIAGIRPRVGFDDLLCWTRIGGLAESKVPRAMDLMSAKVIPQVRHAKAA